MTCCATSTLVDVKTIPNLDKIEMKNGALVIGSTATHRAIERSSIVKQNFPVFAEMETKVANVRVRASGTLGGNLCFAEPHSDPATLLTALGAKAQVQGKSGTRTIAIDKLITGAYGNLAVERRASRRGRDPGAHENATRRLFEVPTQGAPDAWFGVGPRSRRRLYQEINRRRRQRQRRADPVGQSQRPAHRATVPGREATRRRR
jgi:hypothetical protein